MKKTEIMEYFKKCKETQAGIPEEYDIPSDMQEGDSWKLMESTVTEQDVNELEEAFNITFPDAYKEYIMTAAHMFEVVTGNVDNFLFEDDVDIDLKVVPQPYHNELKYIKEELFEGNKTMLEAGYIPLGELINEEGWLCIDTKNNNEIIWLNFEEYVDAGGREDFEEAALHMFSDFSDFIKCFYGGDTCYIEDDEELEDDEEFEE